ncbi:hypothetical protein [Undibacterium terreum]|uniref:Uncharacterized protein n=1 Tax=Undibacterium terreum TaxID=1224302 RepID=A0A916UUP4_9BURK|nr:hypothetical protein [Undibacterium terreum]GGC87653.1 hypothetical protein GCM10011396_38610 [Undibacterium terreum]
MRITKNRKSRMRNVTSITGGTTAEYEAVLAKATAIALEMRHGMEQRVVKSRTLDLNDNGLLAGPMKK